jgi:hypothetical protein
MYHLVLLVISVHMTHTKLSFDFGWSRGINSQHMNSIERIQLRCQVSVIYTAADTGVTNPGHSPPVVVVLFLLVTAVFLLVLQVDLIPDAS